MDLSEKEIIIDAEIKSHQEIASEKEALERYDGEDKVVLFGDLVENLRRKESTAKIFTKIPKLDAITGGFREGQLIVLSAPTGQGKTSLLQSLTKTFSDDLIPCLWFSYEVNPVEFNEKFKLMGETPIFYIPAKNKASNLDWLKMKCREGIAKFGTKIVFIDHLHFLMDMKFLQKVNTSIAIGILMRELKQFALEYGLIIFLVAHLTKTKLEETPGIDDLRDSSFIAQESDYVLIIWRHREKDKNSPTGFLDTAEARLIVAKNRWNGNLGYVKLIYNNARFSELADL